MRLSRCQLDGPGWDLHGRKTEKAAPGQGEVGGQDIPVLTPITVGVRDPGARVMGQLSPYWVNDSPPQPPNKYPDASSWDFHTLASSPFPLAVGHSLAPRRPSAGGEDRLPARGVGAAVLGAAAEEEKESWAQRVGVRVPGSLLSDTPCVCVCVCGLHRHP